MQETHSDSFLGHLSIFMAKHPDIKLVLDAPAKTYAEGAQQLLREAVAYNTTHSEPRS